MSSIKVAITIDSGTLERGRLASECAKLDPAFEKALAEEGLGQELDAWPEPGASGGEAAEALMGQNQPDPHTCGRTHRRKTRPRFTRGDRASHRGSQ